MKPIIGIVARSQKDIDGYSILYANNFCVKAIIDCGGIPFLILPTQGIDYEEKNPRDIARMNDQSKKDLNDVLDKCDGILMPGGYKWYEYDEYICKYAVDKSIPILAICAGMQVLSKTLNNEKINALDNTVKNNTYINHYVKAAKYAHKIKIKKDTLLYKIVGKEEIEVNSRHNYHVPNELSFLASAYSEDGLIEAVEYANNKFTLGVQWHPESMIDYDINSKKIIENLINASRK